MNSDKIIENLLFYLTEGLFSKETYDKFVIIPEEEDVCSSINNIIGVCINEIIEVIKNDFNEKKIKNIMKKSLSNFNKKQYDTEERSFICECFYQIANIVGINFNDELNAWLYGKILGFLLKIRVKTQ